MNADHGWDPPTSAGPAPPSQVAWRRVEAVVDQLLSAAPEERDTLLPVLCGDDPVLLREVGSLLAADRDAEQALYLEGSAELFAAALITAESPAAADDEEDETSEETGTPATEPTGGTADRAGPYRLLRRIGRGGMGTVYLAERADGQFERRVAVKLIKRGMDTEEVLARFGRERQILAYLRHPNIAALLDAGVTADGRPYLVMEHVEGTPITQYCDDQQLPLPERLALFCRVCDAVGFAHRSLVVHRDLKPSNVLVDAEGQVKLLDFGIAKLLSEEHGAGLTAMRGDAVVVMTPEFASPEQVRGQPVTTAVDVYQLGLLLHELMTGHRAQRFERRTLRELERVVCEQEPLRPSLVVIQRDRLRHRDGTAEDLAPEAVAAARGATPEKLRRRLRGDVDAIVATALRKDPARRYPSVEAMADDVRRHLGQQAVVARDAGLGHRTAKFLWRHRGGALAAAAMAALLAAIATFYTLRIQTERDRARLEAAKASQSAALLERLFESWNPAGTDPLTLPPKDLLRLAVHAAEGDPERGEEERAAMLSLLGGLHAQLEAWDEAEDLLTRALASQESAPGAPGLDLAATLARRARLLILRGQPAAAEDASRRALALRGSLLGPRRIETLRARQQLAGILSWRERFTEAERELRQILDQMPAGATSGETATLLLAVERDLGYMLFHQGRFDEAVPLLEAAHERSRDTFGPLHVASLHAARQLAAAYRDSGRLDEAEDLLQQALEVAGALYGADHDETDWTRLVYALLEVRQNDYAEAEALARRVVAAPNRDADEAVMAPRLCLLGGVRLDRGDPVEAERLLRRSLAIYRGTYPEGHQDERDVLNRLAYVVLARGGRDGTALYAEALATHRERFTHLPPFVSDAPHFLAAAAAMTGDLETAEAIYRQSVTLYRGKLAPGHPHLAATLVGLGQTLLERGRPAAAEPFLRQGLAEWRLGRDAAGAVAHAEDALARCREALAATAATAPGARPPA